ncbi:MAG TPA: ATP-dependent DNA ligase [Kineosporiaceae bacterium]
MRVSGAVMVGEGEGRPGVPPGGPGMLLARVAATSEAVAAAGGRKAKIEFLAQCLREADPGELPVVVTWLSGATRQRRTGLGWASLREPPPAAAAPTLTVRAVDAALERAAAAAGAGSQAARRDLLLGLLTVATAGEQRLLTGLLTGELRHGAQAGLLLEAVAAAHGVPAAAVRRAVMLSGDLAAVAAALGAGGAGDLAGFGLRVGRPLAPMLAGTAPDLATALARAGAAAVEWKLDGVRIQVHRDGSDVAVFTRTLDEITDRVPEVVAAARALPVRSVVLDGEAIVLRAGGRPEPFQVTASRVARRDTGAAAEVPLTTMLFDVLHLDGTDLLDATGDERRLALEAAVPRERIVPRHLVDPADGQEAIATATAFAAGARAQGHEGVVVKSLASPYAMGRRGIGWIKVKPRITLDLVVLAAEWGHGRRTGYLSNLHLGARDPDGDHGEPGGFVMLGKTFKGLTDAMLVWQTEHLQRLAVRSGRWQVDVRPELVVEVAFDGVQSSPRYPAGMALRFARVLAHRPDKPASEADTVATVRQLQVTG